MYVYTETQIRSFFVNKSSVAQRRIFIFHFSEISTQLEFSSTASLKLYYLGAIVNFFACPPLLF